MRTRRPSRWNVHTTFCLAALWMATLTPAPAQREQTGSGAVAQQGLDPELVQAIRESPAGRADGIVHLAAAADLSGADSIRDWAARGQFVVEALQRVARTTQAPLLERLAVLVRTRDAAEYTPYYVLNAVFVRGGTLRAFQSIAALPGVRFVQANKPIPLPEPGPVRGAARMANALPWGVTKIGAPQVWATGVHGQGVVVGNIDSGVNAQHPALLQAYRGTATGSHAYNWFDPTGTYPSAPGDNNNHGTHTMGTMVGKAPGYQIGVAPAARWIAARGCAGNSCFPNHLIAAGQWMLAPTNLANAAPNPAMRPHIVNNSWTHCASANTFYQGVVQAWRAGNIFPAFAAGNYCPKIGAPASYPESFASGATDINDVIAPFSSKGASPLTLLVKPEITAPGVAVLSSLAGGGYGLLDGTSMASPHTAGCAALILSAKPGLPAYQVERVLAYTAVDLGPGGPDMTYGIGRINCFSAVDWAKKPWWQYLWGSGANQFGTWNMNPGDKFVAGDFDADNQDELIAVSTTGWAHLLQYTGAGWQWVWGTGPNGQIGTWKLGPGDQFVSGDFDGNGRDDLVGVSATGWSHLLTWTGSAWQYLWGTGPNGQIAVWKLGAGDQFVAGDFNGDGRDDLIGVSTTGWSHLMTWNGSAWQYLWGTGPNGQIGTWKLGPGDRFIAADFDGDGRDELLGVSVTGWSHLLRWNGSAWQYLWGTGPNGQIGLWKLGNGDRYAAGDYDADGRDELVAFAANGWSHLLEWTGSGWQWLWGNAGAGQIALWNMHPADRFLPGNFDAVTPRDEVFAIKQPWVHLMKYDF